MNTLKIKGIYKHFKGDHYLLEDVAVSSDDGVTELVIYRKLYGDGGLYVREKEDFLEEVDKNKYPDVEQKYKFELLDIKSQRK